MKKDAESDREDSINTIQRSAFYTLAAAAFVSGANLRLFDALLPKVADDFGVEAVQAAVVVTAFTLAYGLFQIVYGPLGDRFGKLRVIAAAALLAAAASLGAAFTGSLSALAALRFAAGAGAAAIIPLSLAWIGDTTAYESRQATLGRFIAFLMMGQVLGPAFGGLFAQIFSWREVFYILAAVFFAAGMVLFREAGKEIPVPRGPETERPGVLKGYLEILRDPWIRTVVGTVFIEGALFFGVFSYAGAYLKSHFSLSYAETGVLLACYGIGAFIYSLSVPRLLKILSESGFIRTAGTVLLVSFCLLAAVPLWQAAAPIIVSAGFGLYMFHNTLQTKATEMAPKARGTGIAVFALSLFLGQAVGVAAAGKLINAAGYGPAFVVSGVLLFILGRLFAGKLAKRGRKSS